MTADPPTPRDLAAGRELDALVAEKVMGWRLYKSFGPRGWCQWENVERNVMAAGVKEAGAGFCPSTDIGAAWQVIEKLRGRFPQIDIEILPDRVTVTLWEQCRHDGAALDPLDEVEADTAPLAICHAAIKAAADRASPQP